MQSDIVQVGLAPVYSDDCDLSTFYTLTSTTESVDIISQMQESSSLATLRRYRYGIRS